MDRTVAQPGLGYDKLDLALRRELEMGEFVRWQARPLARIRLSSFFMWVFAIPWTAFSVFWTAMAFHAMDEDAMGSAWGWIFPLWGTPFIAVGLAMLSGPFLPLFTARRMLFAITDRRVIEITFLRTLTVSSLAAHQIGTMRRQERRDGSGMVGILRREWTDSDGDNRQDWMRIGDVPNVREVESQLRRLAQSATRPTDDAAA